MSSTARPRIRIYHHSLWAKYKGAIFTNIYAKNEDCPAETSFVHVAETASNRLGFSDVDLSYHRYPYEVLFKGPYERVSVFRLTLSLVANLLAHPSELVILHGYHRIEHWAMLATCLLFNRRRAVFVDSTARDSNKNLFKESAKKLFFRYCDGFFCYGARSKEYVLGYGIDEAKIFSRCQAAALPHDYDAAAIRSHYANEQKAYSREAFLYVGRLSPEKGLFDLLDAFCQFVKVRPLATLRIVGSGVTEIELKRKCVDLCIDSSVEFAGTKNAHEIGNLFLNSSALILPSHSEPWGLVINESLSYGCPVIVSDACGCVPELVQEGETGYSFKTGDVSALFKAMVKVVQLEQKRSVIAQSCLRLVEQYTTERAAQAILTGCFTIVGQ